MEKPRKSEINPNYVEFIICESCGCKVYSRFKDSKKCMSCLKDEHHAIANKLGTNEKLVYKTKIDYNKYSTK